MYNPRWLPLRPESKALGALYRATRVSHSELDELRTWGKRNCYIKYRILCNGDRASLFAFFRQSCLDESILAFEAMPSIGRWVCLLASTSSCEYREHSIEAVTDIRCRFGYDQGVGLLTRDTMHTSNTATGLWRIAYSTYFHKRIPKYRHNRPDWNICCSD